MISYSKLSIAILLAMLVAACANGTKEGKSEEISAVELPKFQNKGHELVYEMIEKTGSYQDLLDLKDVVYEYTYRTPDQKEDVSIESYIFDGELSHANYLKHE